MKTLDKLMLAMTILLAGDLVREQILWNADQPVAPSPAPTPDEWLQLRMVKLPPVAMPSPCSALDYTPKSVMP